MHLTDHGHAAEFCGFAFLLNHWDHMRMHRYGCHPQGDILEKVRGHAVPFFGVLVHSCIMNQLQ